MDMFGYKKEKEKETWWESHLEASNMMDDLNGATSVFYIQYMSF